VRAEHGSKFALVLDVQLGRPVRCCNHRSLVPDRPQGSGEAEDVGVGLWESPDRSPRRGPRVGHLFEEVGNRGPTLAIDETPVAHRGEDLRHPPWGPADDRRDFHGAMRILRIEKECHPDIEAGRNEEVGDAERFGLDEWRNVRVDVDGRAP
jgi:hypothetical protein